MDTALELDLEEDVAFLHSFGDVSDYELERGKPMPSFNHSIIQSNLIVALAKHKKYFRVASELSLKLPTMKATPDVCLYAQRKADFRNDQITVAEAPLLVIEIISPSQTTTSTFKKFDRYFENGVHSCWLVQPELQSITVVHPTGKPHTADAGMLEDSALGIAIQVEEVFE